MEGRTESSTKPTTASAYTRVSIRIGSRATKREMLPSILHPSVGAGNDLNDLHFFETIANQ